MSVIDQFLNHSFWGSFRDLQIYDKVQAETVILKKLLFRPLIRSQPKTTQTHEHVYSRTKSVVNHCNIQQYPAIQLTTQFAINE